VEEVKALCEEFNLEVLFSGLLMKALKEINYQWALAMEPLPPFPNPFIGIRMEKYLPLRDVYAEECITRLRQYEREV
jgi:hypothetical protein